GAVSALAPVAPLGITPGAEASGRFDRALITGGVLATIAIATLGIRDKEAIISGGRILHIALAPVDPRSLIQGDYMALRFALPNDPAGLKLINDASKHPIALARTDNRQVATVTRIAPEGTQPGEGEFPLILTKRKGRWSLGTDAWYFAEGSAKKFEVAKFGTFRVSQKGDMILVGMADEHLRPIQP
ncbi:MAG TPA: GDYXXLXY domain-containing protein, partial [Beijerinckiaceae bacterium]|nr:GDYXXLXY domain-containing protein [Beijerinckiaceae bacterium]